MHITPDQITGLILAGGRGSRMGHVDKGLQQLHARPLASYALERLTPQVGVVAINANRSQHDYASFNIPVWPDLLPDYPGPLAGLHSGLSHCSTAYLATVPCDSPYVPTDLVARLSAAMEEEQTDAALAVTERDGQRQRHPVCCLLKKTLLPALTQSLQNGDRKMERWFASIHTSEVLFDDDSAFSNINTLEQLQQLEEQQQQ